MNPFPGAHTHTRERDFQPPPPRGNKGTVDTNSTCLLCLRHASMTQRDVLILLLLIICMWLGKRSKTWHTRISSCFNIWRGILSEASNASNSTTQESADVSLLWAGGSDPCFVCPEGRLVQEYACSNQRAQWNDGVAFFHNTIPPQNIITSATMVLSGAFYCQVFQQGTELWINLQGDQMLVISSHSNAIN